MLEQMKEAGKQAIKQQAKKLGRKLLLIVLKYIVLPIVVVLLIVTLIYGLYCLLTGKFTDSKNDSSEVYTLDSEHGYVADVSDELIKNIQENLKASSIDMKFLGKDEATQRENIKKFVMAEMKSSYPNIDPLGFKNNEGGIFFKKASTGNKLKFMEPQKFHNKVKENNTEVLNYFTIEGDTFYYADASYVVTDGVRTSTTINERSGNYKTMASGYGVPYEFFINLTVHTGQLDFALELAEYVINNSGLTITIMDTTTTTNTTITVDYDWYYEGYKEYTFNAEATGVVKEGESNNNSGIGEFQPPKPGENQKPTLPGSTTNSSIKIDRWTEKWVEGLNKDVDNSANVDYDVTSGSIYKSTNLEQNYNREYLLRDYKKEFGEDEFYQNTINNTSVTVEAIIRKMVQKTGEANEVTAPNRVNKELEHQKESTNVIHYDTSSYTRVTEVESWIGNIIIAYEKQMNAPTKTYGDSGENTNLANSEWENVEDNKDTANSKDYKKQKQKKYEEQYRVFNNSTDVKYELTSTVGHIQRQKRNTVQNVYEEVVTQTYNMEPEKVEKQDEKVKGIVKLLKKGYEDTFTGIKNIAGDLLVDSADMWFSELEHNESTKNLANVMRYILYKYSGNDYGITDLESLLLDWLHSANSIGSIGTGYWWPIGGQDITVENGKEFAKGPPTTTLITAGMIYPSGDYHGAMDIGGQGRTNYHNVISATNGTVIAINDGVADGTGESYGNYIKIKATDGNTIIYAHLYRGTLKVAVGETVQQGQLLAKLGHSGNSTGPHLHFEVRDGNNNQIDPQTLCDSKNPRPTGGALIEFLKRFEGSGTIRNGKYIVEDDGLNIPTVGPGINISANKEKFRARGIDPDSINHFGAEVDKQIVDDIFNETVNSHYNSVNKIVAGLNLESYQKDALASLHFNLGNINGFVNAYKNYSATEELYTNYFRKKGHTELKGIKRRRRAEFILFTTGSYDSNGNDYY